MSVTMTPDDLAKLGRHVVNGVAVKIDQGIGTTAPKSEAPPTRRTASTVPVVSSPAPDSIGLRYKSKGEAMYGGHLYVLRQAGEILEWRYEAITLRLGDRVRYTPDFYVRPRAGAIKLHEVKGPQYWEQARVKLGAAAALYPEFEFFLVRVRRLQIESITRIEPLTQVAA